MGAIYFQLYTAQSYSDAMVTLLKLIGFRMLTFTPPDNDSRIELEAQSFLGFHHEIANCKSAKDAWAATGKVLIALGFTQMLYITVPPHGLREVRTPKAIAWEAKGKSGLYMACGNTPKTHDAIMGVVNAIPIMGSDEPIPVKDEHQDFRDLISTEFDMRLIAPCFASQVYGPRNNNGFFIFTLKPRVKVQISTLTSFAHIALNALHAKLTQFRLDEERRSKQLSKRENEVLQQVMKGKSNTQIAEVLKLSPFTVNGYIRSVCLKLECSDRITASLRAIAYGIA